MPLQNIFYMRKFHSVNHANLTYNMTTTCGEVRMKNKYTYSGNGVDK